MPRRAIHARSAKRVCAFDDADCLPFLRCFGAMAAAITLIAFADVSRCSPADFHFSRALHDGRYNATKNTHTAYD